MYKLEIMKAPDSDASNEETDSDFDDLVSAIDINLPDGSVVSREKNIIYIQTVLDEKELKKSMKPAFSYHIGNIRFVSIVSS
jgi:hypothetical protein